MVLFMVEKNATAQECGCVSVCKFFYAILDSFARGTMVQATRFSA